MLIVMGEKKHCGQIAISEQMRIVRGSNKGIRSREGATSA